MAIIDEMLRRNLRPGAAAFNAVLHTMATSRDSHFDGAMRIVDMMQQSSKADMGLRLGSDRARSSTATLFAVEYQAPTPARRSDQVLCHTPHVWKRNCLLKSAASAITSS